MWIEDGEEKKGVWNNTDATVLKVSVETRSLLKKTKPVVGLWINFRIIFFRFLALYARIKFN